MKQVCKYRCEFCNVEYADRMDAVKCEENHRKPLKIIRSHYLPRPVNKGGWPDKITVKLSDGSEISYYR